jgi:hypothetical protein
MKLTSIFLASMAAVAHAESSNRGLATLAQKWNLTEPVFEYGSNSFTLDFTVTDYIAQGMTKYSLWKAPDCQEGNQELDTSTAFKSKSSSDVVGSTDFADPTGSGDDPAGGKVFLNMTFDPETISSSDIYTESEIDNQMIAVVRFCVRFGLWTPTTQTTPVEVNFLETLITLTVDLTDGFEIGSITVEPKNRLVRTANQAYEVIGYECDAAKNRLTELERTAPRNQGEVITVCVEPEQEAKDDGIFMRSVDDFFFSRPGTTALPAGVRQEAIVDNAEAGNLLTTYTPADCAGTLVCTFSTILFAQFYTSLGEVNGAGVASMQFGTTTPTRRELRAGAREAQADAAGAAEFDLQFEVNIAEVQEGSGASTSIGALCMSMAALFGAAALL